MSETEAHARAIEAIAVSAKPIAEAVGRSIDKSTDAVLDTLKWGASRLGKIVDLAGSMAHDPIYVWHCTNRVRLLGKLKDLDLPAGAVPEGWAARVISAAQDEEDDELLDLWARLLAGGANEAGRHPALIHVLRQLSEADAASLVDVLRKPGGVVIHRVRHPHLPAAPSTAEHELLESLGVVRWDLAPRLESRAHPGAGLFSGDQDLRDERTLRVTALGDRLREALCIPQDDGRGDYA